MPFFANPFQGNAERKLTKEEIIKAIRLDIANELETIKIYDSHVQSMDDAIAQRVIRDIRDEEKTHVGELMTLLMREWTQVANSETEAKKMLNELNMPKVNK